VPTRKPHSTDAETDALVNGVLADLGVEVMESQDNSNAEVATRKFNREELGSIQSFAEAMALAASQYGTVLQAHEVPELGDGFTMVEDKEDLVDKPFLILTWEFHESDMNDGEWTLLRCVSEGKNGEAEKFVFTDGSTGISRELKEFTLKTGRDGAMFVRHGLRFSKYYIDEDTKEALTKRQVQEYMVSKKKMREARTYYLNTNA